VARWYQLQVTAELSQNDIVRMDFDNVTGCVIYISQNVFTDDGYRIVEYDDADMAETLRDGSKAVLRSYGNNNAYSQTQYDTYAEAQTAIAALSPSDGYELIDLEQPIGSAPSAIIQRRPALWNFNYANNDGSTGGGSKIDQRVNGWGRTEQDRI